MAAFPSYIANAGTLLMLAFAVTVAPLEGRQADCDMVLKYTRGSAG